MDVLPHAPVKQILSRQQPMKDAQSVSCQDLRIRIFDRAWHFLFIHYHDRGKSINSESRMPLLNRLSK